MSRQRVLDHWDGGCIAAWHVALFLGGVGWLVFVDAQLLGAGAVSAPATDAILSARPNRDDVEAWKLRRVRKEPSDDGFGCSARLERDLAAVRRVHQHAQYRLQQGPGRGEETAPGPATSARRITAQTLPRSELLSIGIRGIRMHVIDDAGPFGWIEQSAEFNRVLAEFIGY